MLLIMILTSFLLFSVARTSVIESHPYLAVISRNINVIRLQICTGTIIQNRWVVTVAHCIEKFGKKSNAAVKSWYVHAGKDVYETVNNIATSAILVQMILIHPSWETEWSFYDVGLVYLETDLVYSETIQPAPIFKIEPKKTHRCNIAGWVQAGSHKGIRGFFNRSMREFPARVVGKRQCTKMWDINKVIDDAKEKALNRYICVWSDSELACIGDSGAPLLCNGVFVGMVSMHFPCKKDNVFLVVMRLKVYYWWILSSTQLPSLLNGAEGIGKAVCFLYVVVWMVK